MRQLLFATVLVCWTCLALAASGCNGSQRAAVKGKVTVDGFPLPEGTISFVGDPSAGPSAGDRIANGEYSIPADMGPLPGEYKVQIRAFRATGRKVWDGMGDDRAPASQKRMVEEMEPYLPAKYNDRTELRATIVGGKVNVCDFDLQLEKVKH